MYEVKPFSYEDLLAIEPQHQQAREYEELLAYDWKAIAKCKSVSYTVCRRGWPIASGGVFEVWPGRGNLWAMIDRGIGPGGLLVAAKCGRDNCDRLIAAGIRRIETSVLDSFENGHRLIRLLGFQKEGLMRRYDSLGRNHAIYARVD